MDIPWCPCIDDPKPSRRGRGWRAMRSVKSLVSGFGVAVSLVGAVACAFFITAALVAFHGSLDVFSSYQPASPPLTASATQDPPIVIGAVAVARVQEPVAAVVDVPARARPAARIGEPEASRHTVTKVTQTPAPPRTTPPPQVTPTVTRPSATAPLANATTNLANTVGAVVGNATSSLGSAVAPLSPALGGVVQGLGTGLAGGVVALGDTVGGVVNALGVNPAGPQG
jgi:hypothetical protein